MSSLIFLNDLPVKQMSPEDIDQTIKAEQLYFQHRPKTLYHLAVNGDEIIDSPNKSVAINIFKGDKAPEGFLVKQEGVNHG